MIHAQDVAYDPVIPSRGAGGGDNTNWASQSHLLFLRRHRASPPLRVSQFGTYPIVDPIDCLFRAISPEGDVSPSGVPCLFCVLSPTVRSGGRALIKTRSVGRGGGAVACLHCTQARGRGHGGPGARPTPCASPPPAPGPSRPPPPHMEPRGEPSGLQVGAPSGPIVQIRPNHHVPCLSWRATYAPLCTSLGLRGTLLGSKAPAP